MNHEESEALEYVRQVIIRKRFLREVKEGLSTIRGTLTEAKKDLLDVDPTREDACHFLLTMAVAITGGFEPLREIDEVAIELNCDDVRKETDEIRVLILECTDIITEKLLQASSFFGQKLHA